MAISKAVRSFLGTHTTIRKVAGPMLSLRRRLLNKDSIQRATMLSDLHSNIVAGSATVRAEGFPGEYAMDIRSHILSRILLDKHYEPRVVSIVKRQLDPSQDALDVGANVGLFSILMASLLASGCRVLAIEPTSRALEFLRHNIQANGFGEVVSTFAGVASDRNGEVTVESVPGKEEYSSIGSIVHQSVANESARVSNVVQSRTIDALTGEFNLRPGFMKVDTEGAELLVLSGAKDTLKEYRPIIVSELSDMMLSARGHSAREVIAFLENVGYMVVDVNDMQPITSYPFNGDILATDPRTSRCN
jgi:FkbM family methyltransferase